MSTLTLLLWKNWILHRRKWFSTLLELFLPCLALLILLFVRQQVQSENYPNITRWNAFDVSVLPNELEPEYSAWKLAYAPDTADVRKVMESVIATVEGVTDLLGFPNESSMESFFYNLVNKTVKQTLAGVVFTSNNILESQRVEYKLRFPYKLRFSTLSAYRQNPFRSDNNWLTNLMYQLVPLTGPRAPGDSYAGVPGYYPEGFLGMQANIDLAIIEFLKQRGGLQNRSVADLHSSIAFQRTPYPPYLKDNFILVIQNQLPFLVVLAFMFSSLNIVKNIVYEKEKQLKESLKMMGISNGTHWLAWFITYNVLCTISIIFMVICMRIFIPPNGCIVNKSDPTVLFLFLWLYACSVIAFCFAISVFFKSANAGAAAGGIVFFTSFLPYTYMRNRYQSYSWGEKVAVSLVPNVAMCLGSRLIGNFEGENIGVQWNNLAMGVNVDEPFSMLHVLVMLVIDTFVYSFIAWYIELVFPGEYGVPKPWYFIFQRHFWCNRWDNSKASDVTLDVPTDDYRLQHNDFFQEEPSNVRPGIQTCGLTKVFGHGSEKRVAVNNLNVNMYRGEITVLLGHNGAGKTTTMSMLTGFIPASSGTAIINGYDIRTDLDKVRQSLGLCPQHDVLFDHLTVWEHLTFFAKLKGVKASGLAEEIENMLVRVNLTSKRHVLASNLSGGMRRRLSIGIALIGGSEVIILDEPTSGLDPDARRELWTLLQQERASRTMLLTTHFMDEADVLGDRVAIMAAGQVQCYGTPLFLKNKYGADYHLTLVKTHDCHEEHLFHVIQQHVPDYKVESNISDELDLLLPAASAHLFRKLFTELEEKKDELGIRNYGVSITTMEEVFLKVGKYQEQQEIQRDEEQHNPTSSVSNSLIVEVVSASNPLNVSNMIGQEDSHNSGDNMNIHLRRYAAGGKEAQYSAVPDRVIIENDADCKYNSGIRLFAQQFVGLLLKRLICFYRNKWMTISQMIIPVVFTVIGLVILRTVPIAKTLPPLALNLDKFSAIKLPYSVSSNATLSDLQRNVIQCFVDLFRSRPKTTVIRVDDRESTFEDFLLSQAERDIFRFDQQYILGSVFDSSPPSGGSLNWRAYFNGQPYHSSGILQNYISNALLHYVRGSSDIRIATINYPLPKTSDDKFNDLIIEEGMAFTVALNIVFGMSFLAGTISTFLIRERSSRAKHLQYLSGVMPVSYWTSTFLWDLVNILFPSIFVVIAFVGFNEPAYTGNGRAAIVLLLLMSFAFSVIPMMYLMSHLFTVPSTGLVWLVIFNIISGSITLITVNILRIPQLELQDLSDVLNRIFMLIFPTYCLGQGIADIYINHLFLDICMRPEIQEICEFGIPNPCCLDNCGVYCAEYNTNYLGWKASGIGRMLTFLTIQGVVFFAILFAMDTSLFARIHSNVVKVINLCMRKRDGRLSRGNAIDGTASSCGGVETEREDDDVHTERLKLLAPHLDKSNYCLILSEVTKRYGSLIAVDHISCSVAAGQCFGLLGVNGAGKTTTFKMITGDLTLSSGEIYIDGINSRENRRAAQKSLGYCPQFDALIEELTGRELLTFFARLRGIRDHEIKKEVTELIRAFHLDIYANIQCGKYSGGNKRKLSTAIALVGSPNLVCLDEPTTGMDPMARRQLWNTLSRYRDGGKTLILTSHSMEECEALCTNIAIMVNGQFQCLGSCQHLKAKFAEGYTLLIQVRYPSEEEGEAAVQRVLEFLESEFGTCEMKDRHQGHMHLYLPKTAQLTWAHIFGTMEDNLSSLSIVYYSVTQTSLEQVFLGFARNQKPPSEAEFACCSCWGRCCQE